MGLTSFFQELPACCVMSGNNYYINFNRFVVVYGREASPKAGTPSWPDVEVGNLCSKGFSGDSDVLLDLGISALIQRSHFKWVG